MRGGRISEVRAYFMNGANESTELTEFPYTQRGYLTLRR
jgi:hypothetical protein